MTESIRDSWSTPDILFKPIHKKWIFTLDAAATKDNAKVKHNYFGPDHIDPDRHDAFKCDWSHNNCWLNPPYSNIGPWLQKAYYESQRSANVVVLVPLDPSTRWWIEGVMLATRIEILTGSRVQFDPPPGVKASSNTKPSALLYYYVETRKELKPYIGYTSYWEWNKEKKRGTNILKNMSSDEVDEIAGI